jgi:hypothetical protein
MEHGLYEGTEKERKPNDYQKGTEWLKYWDAAIRHLTAWRDGEDNDESELSHIAHAAASCLILLWYIIMKVGKDDR